MSLSSSVDHPVPGDDVLLELDHEGGAVVPVRAHFGREVAAVERRLNDAGGEGGAVETALVLRDGDEPVHERLLLDYVEGLLVVVRPFQLVGLFVEQGLCRTESIYPQLLLLRSSRLNVSNKRAGSLANLETEVGEFRVWNGNGVQCTPTYARQTVAIRSRILCKNLMGEFKNNSNGFQKTHTDSTEIPTRSPPPPPPRP